MPNHREATDTSVETIDGSRMLFLFYPGCEWPRSIVFHPQYFPSVWRYHLVSNGLYVNQHIPLKGTATLFPIRRPVMNVLYTVEDKGVRIPRSYEEEVLSSIKWGFFFCLFMIVLLSIHSFYM